MKGAYVFAGLTCLAVLVAAPRLPGGASAAPTNATNEARPARINPWSKNSAPAPKQVAVQHAWRAGETTLVRDGDGHFYAPVTANGVETRMLVDTGASVIALTGRDAEALGIRWNASDIKPVGEGAGGPVYGVPTTLDIVRLGSIELRDVQAVVLPEGLGVSLLGQSFLRQLENVEVRDNTMLLSS